MRILLIVVCAGWVRGRVTLWGGTVAFYAICWYEKRNTD